MSFALALVASLSLAQVPADVKAQCLRTCAGEPHDAKGQALLQCLTSCDAIAVPLTVDGGSAQPPAQQNK